MNIHNLVNLPLAMQRERIPQFLASVESMPDDRQPPKIEPQIVTTPSSGARAGAILRSSVKPVKGGIAVLPAFGASAQHRGQTLGADFFYEELVAALSGAVSMPNISACVVLFDGPGGIASGTHEAFNSIRALGRAKPIIGVIKSHSASANYYLASATSPLFIQESGSCGSIGVWTAHADASKAWEKIGVKWSLISSGRYKVEGNEFSPLSKETRDHLQKTVDNVHSQFIADVAEGRGVPESVVRKNFGQGRMLEAREAMGAMMVDGIATTDEVLTALLSESQGRSGRARAGREPSHEQLATARRELTRRRLARAEAWDFDA